MTVQDDSRENELIQLFNLERPVNLTRSGTDAILTLNALKIPFELKVKVCILMYLFILQIYIFFKS